MTRRVIKGKTYDTDTAQHVASASGTYTRGEGAGLTVSRDVYRMGAETFFLVDCVESIRDIQGVPTVVETTTMFYPLSYDQTVTFVRGDDLVVTDIRLGLGGMHINILDETLFRPVTERAPREETG